MKEYLCCKCGRTHTSRSRVFKVGREKYEKYICRMCEAGHEPPHYDDEYYRLILAREAADDARMRINKESYESSDYDGS